MVSEDSANRRGFVRKIMGLVAAGGIASVLLGRQVEQASAVSAGEVWIDDGTGVHTTDSTLRWTSSSLGVGTSTPSAKLHVSGTTPNILMGDSANTITGGKVGATISGGGESGYANTVGDDYGTVGGGESNAASGMYSTVGGGVGNTASGESSTGGGGEDNTAGGNRSTVGGGIHNTANGEISTVSGGTYNAASGHASTVGGGDSNTASSNYCTVGGGDKNTASGYGYSTVGGGYWNTASSDSSTVGGGSSNQATGGDSTVGGGGSNAASNTSSTVGGGSSNVASGYGSTVPGGLSNTAAGDYSFAGGRGGKVDATHAGAFLYADSNDADFNSVAANEFAVRCTGGARFVTAIDGSTGNPTMSFAMTPAGNLGIGTTNPVRQLHIVGSNAVARMDRNVDSASFIFVRTSTDFNTVLKSFTFGVKATGVDTGSFFIGDMHTNVSGSSDNRILIDTSGNVGIGTTTPSSKLHVNGRVKALGYDTGDIRFANGYRLTEDKESGMLLVNEDGEGIARFDHDGNLRIKGRLIQEA